MGCSQSATILMADGTTYEAAIVNSDSEFLYARSHLDEREFAPPQNELIKLKKHDVVEIDHPGNVHLLVGSLLTGVGFINGAAAWVLFSDTRGDASNEFFAFQILANAVVYLGVGVPMGLWGWTTWDDSKTLAKSSQPFTPETQPRLLLVPTVDTKQGKLGLSLHLNF